MLEALAWQWNHRWTQIHSDENSIYAHPCPSAFPLFVAASLYKAG